MKRRLQRIYFINHDAYLHNSSWDLIGDFKKRTLEEASKEIDIPWKVDSVDFLSSNSVIITVVTDSDPRPFAPSDPVSSDSTTLLQGN